LECGQLLRLCVGASGTRLACERSDRIAAITPVEGAQNLDCRPTNPVSAIIFHGTADRLVPFEFVASAPAFWVKEDGCASVPVREDSATVHTSVYSACKDRTGIALYAIEGGRHMWPGGRLSGNHLPATNPM
jgi:polyhydroxybutyrate depolymerase